MSDRGLSLVGLACALAPLCANAQQSPDLEPSGALDEIVITAQRRSEPLDQVPIAASVIAGSELEKRGVDNIVDLPSLAPSLTIQNQGALAYVNIRGVGIQSTNPTTSSGVANYADGFFIPHETAISGSYFDIGQIEVLRGPQGTLVGQSSTGGAIFVNSVKPSLTGVSGFVEQTFGNFGYARTEGAVNAPVSEKLAIRLAVQNDRRDSFYSNIGVADSAFTHGLEPGNVDAQAARIGVKFVPTSDIEVYLKYELQNRKGDGFAAKSYGELAGANNAAAAGLSNPFNISYDFPSFDKSRLWRTSAELNWNLTDTLVLRSLTGYQHEALRNDFDNDFTLRAISSATQLFSENTFEQEINLISNNPGAFNWILGAFYLHDSTPTYLRLTVPPTVLIQTGPSERSYALFAQGTYSFAPRWQVALGGRANRNEKTSTGTQQLVGFPFPPVPLDAKIKTSEPTGKLSLSYFPDSSSTVYVSASRGFKAGGANPGNSVNFIFDPEKINAYEAGYKTGLLAQHLRFSAATYYYDYENLQTTVFDPVARQAIVNVPSARIYGAELDFSGSFDAWVFNLGVGYNESKVNETFLSVDARNPLAGPVDLTGRRLSYAPRWTGSAGATYAVAIGIGKLAVTAQYSYGGQAWASLFEAEPVDVLGSHSLVNANLALLFADGLRFEAYGSNLADQRYAVGTLGADAAIWAAPRQYGVRLSYEF
jgi:iron complex outermembrane receptor protein